VLPDQIDEIHTPDSSRYWIGESYEQRVRDGLEPEMIDKEFLRIWFRGHCDPYADLELPMAPHDLVVELAFRYVSLYEAITGEEFPFERASEADHAAGLLRGVAEHASSETQRAVILYDRDRDAHAVQSLVAGIRGGPTGVAVEPYHVAPAAQTLHLLELSRALSKESAAGLKTIIVVVCTDRLDHVSAIAREQSRLPVLLLLMERPGTHRSGSMSINEQATCVDASAAGVLVSTNIAGCLAALRTLFSLVAVRL
jgi:hypothetical protein